MSDFTVLLNEDAYTALGYLSWDLGAYFQAALPKNYHYLGRLQLLKLLLETKKPCLFAEGEISGDGSDWAAAELRILGDVSAALWVNVYDDGSPGRPVVYPQPFPACLIYVSGPVLTNHQAGKPIDWDEVTDHEVINPEGYYRLFERRLLPVLRYINFQASRTRKAFVTIPGLGCGESAGRFEGTIGPVFRDTLEKLLCKYGASFKNIAGVYYSPYSECDYGFEVIEGIDFMVEPRSKGGRSQLCKPSEYGSMYSRCDLYSLAEWNPVSWPGNDFYEGNRSTDGAAKSAATDSMFVMTGVEGIYNEGRYLPPKGYANWEEVVMKNDLKLNPRYAMFFDKINYRSRLESLR